VAPATKTLVLSTSMTISGFGEDESGELSVFDLSGGTLYRFDATT
jgi:hypothetical protein